MTSATGTSNAAQSRIGDSLLHGMVVALVLTVVQRFSGLFRGVLFCWFMDEAELGLWSLTQSWLFMLAPMAVFGITGVLRRYVEHYRSKGQLNQFLRWSLGVSAGLTFFASLVLASGATTFSTWMFQDATQWQLIRLMSMTLAAVVVFNTLQDLADSFKMLRIASWMRLLHSIAFTVVAIVAILCFEPSVNVVTTSFLVATLIAILPGLWVIKAYRGSEPNRERRLILGRCGARSDSSPAGCGSSISFQICSRFLTAT